jgi:hypothetical protein
MPCNALCTGSKEQKATLRTFLVLWRRSGFKVEALGGRGDIIVCPREGHRPRGIIAMPAAETENIAYFLRLGKGPRAMALVSNRPTAPERRGGGRQGGAKKSPANRGGAFRH